MQPKEKDGNIKTDKNEKNTNDNKKLDKVSKKQDRPKRESKWL